MSESGRWTTKCGTADGVVYNLGEFEHPPKHEHLMACPSCLVVNAWTELELAARPSEEKGKGER